MSVPRPPSTAALAAFLVAAALAFAPALRAQPAAPGKIALRVAYVPVITWLPSWVAKDRGLFDRNGLDVTLSPIQNLSLLPPTMGRQFEIASSTPPDLIKAAASGIDVVAVAGETIEVSANQTMQVLVRADSGIKSLQDLKGRLIATPTLGAVMHVATLHWLKAGGVDPAAVRAVEMPFPSMGDQLKAGRVDAVELLNPFVGQLLAQGNLSVGDPMLSVGDPVLFTFWIAQGEWARANPAALQRWRRSLGEARAFIQSNPSEARSILARYTHLPDAVAQKIPFPVYEFAMSPAQLEVWVRTLRELDQLSGAVDPAKLVAAPD